MRVVLIAAQSLDGFITRHETPGTAFTSPEDRAWFPACLAGFDSVAMGGVSYRETREQVRAELDRVPRRRFVLTRNPAAFAAEVVPGRLEFTAEPPAELLVRLAREGVRDCALLGGSEINGLFLAAGLVDELWLTLEPRLFGTGRPLASGRLDSSWHLDSSERLGPDVLLVKYTRAALARETLSATAARLGGTVLAVTLAITAAGAVLGAVLFPLIGRIAGSETAVGALALRGVKELGFYFGIWAPGIGIVVATIREWRRRHPESPLPPLRSGR